MMELLKLSKLKLQLQALVAEVRDLRDRERSATEQQHLLIQKLKRNEEECGRKIQELQGELTSVKEERQKQERKVNYLENDNVLLENKQKELKGTLNNLLQSRENFVHAYEESTSQMKRSIETKDRMLSVLSEKISSYLALFDSIEKEVFCIKQIVDKVQNIVNDKEEVVTSLKKKMDWVSAFEKAFVENISDLRNKLENSDAELRRKDRIILELEAKLDAAKLHNNNQAQMEDISIPALNSYLSKVYEDNKKYYFSGTGSTFFQFNFFHLALWLRETQDKRLFSSILQHEEAIAMEMKIVDNRLTQYRKEKKKNALLDIDMSFLAAGSFLVIVHSSMHTNGT
ncbi:intracellular protein transport protein USO isoform X1 [Spatholobus suberectus]|nr:intracellular protein transport protein USO isoform X1 [Spatholobus suberectus]